MHVSKAEASVLLATGLQALLAKAILIVGMLMTELIDCNLFGS